MSKYLTLKNLGWLFTAFVAVMLGMGGFSKIIGTEEMVGNFTFMNLSDYLLMVGVLEVLGVGLLVYPKTSLYGSVLIGSIMTARGMYAFITWFSRYYDANPTRSYRIRRLPTKRRLIIHFFR